MKNTRNESGVLNFSDYNMLLINRNVYYIANPKIHFV